MATIVLVDDEEAIAWTLSHTLRMAGHTPIVAPNGHEALRALRGDHDLLVLDLGLPDLSGAEVLRRVKRNPETARIPVIVVSGHPDATDLVARDPARGAVVIFQKPIYGSELCAAVEIVLAAHSTGADATPAHLQSESYPDHNLLYRLISAGSDLLVRQVCRRLGADRGWTPRARTSQAPSWADIVRWARREELIDDADGVALLEGASAQTQAQPA
jgi:DNA-binding response OmpR family regulator